MEKNFKSSSGEERWSDLESLDGEDEGIHRLYYEEIDYNARINDEDAVVAGIGIVISDFKGEWIVKIKKPLFEDALSTLESEIRALIVGLKAAKSLELKNVIFICSHQVHDLIGETLPGEEQKIADLVIQVRKLQTKFDNCEPRLSGIDPVWETLLLRKVNIFAEEYCGVCMGYAYSRSMVFAYGCEHRYCRSCVEKHVRVQASYGMLPKCPDGCKSDVSVESLQNFLPAEMTENLKRIIREASIPGEDRTYCPNKVCSEAVSKREIRGRRGAWKCRKCETRVCIKCMLPWHSNMTCDQNKRSDTKYEEEQKLLEKLKETAEKKKWRQCPKCSCMIERNEGCLEIKCRFCGLAFCYKCGIESSKAGSNDFHKSNCVNDDDDDDDDDDGDVGHLGCQIC